TMEPRMMTLTLSNAPTRNNKPSDNQKTLDKPNRSSQFQTRRHTRVTFCPSASSAADALRPTPSQRRRRPGPHASNQDQPVRSAESDRRKSASVRSRLPAGPRTDPG